MILLPSGPSWGDDRRRPDNAKLKTRIDLGTNDLRAKLARASQLSPLSQQALNEIIDHMLWAEGKK